MKTYLVALLVLVGMVPIVTSKAQSLYPQGIFPLIYQANDGRLTHTVGELAVLQFPGKEGPSLQPGYLPSVIAPLTVTGIYNAPGLSFTCSVYPNPASSSLHVQITDGDVPELMAALLDINGKSIQKKTLPAATRLMEWPIKDLSPGTYILTLTHPSGLVVYTAQLIKH